MDWTAITVIGSTIALFIWNRAESRADARQAAEDYKQHRRDLVDVQRETTQAINAAQKETTKAINEGQKETTKAINAIHLEMKDFHNRLCAIEERRYFKQPSDKDNDL